MSADLSIAGKGLSNWIAQGGHTVAGPYTSHGNAIAALPGVQARLRPVTITPCLCCGDQFKSTGKGNRLCPSCKRDA